MRILFLGEYSNVHWTLAEGLRALGHEVTVISNGDFWKNYPRDIDLVRKPGFLGGIIYYIKALALLPKLRGYDIVQLINPMFLELKAERIFFFYDYLRRHNKKVFLCAFGMDYYWAYTNAHQKPLRYSDFNIGSERRTDPIAMADYNDWVGTGKERLNKYIAEDCDAIISGLYEYDVTYRTAGFGSKTIFIPFPIVPCENPCTTITEKLNLFIGISRSRSAYKGTDIMLRAAQRIAEKYPERVELTVAEGVPFHKYKQMLNKADVILDQLYAYTPAMNALEAMNRGTILVGGGEEEQYDIINEKELRPIINVLPTEESVYNELERLILHGNIQQLKHDSVEYIRHHHDYIKVAKEYERVYAALNSPLMGDALPLNSQVLDKEKSIDKTNLKSSPLRGGLRGALILLALMLSLTAFAQQGIAQIPQQTRHIKPLRLDEADMDISRQVLQTDKVTQGFNLPQAYTGEGVVLGVTDIGFDFTHPNFKGLNIVGFWDMLSRDTLNSYTPVFTGRDYSAEEFKNLQHSYDALEETHGTHVLGIAAGTSQTYRGIAPNADILLVNNVLSNNFEQVDSLQKPKLEGNYKLEEFQYMFDYAASKGQPCVINISAGTRQSFGDNFETNNHAISKLCGPGRIIVASAGNNGMQAITLHKRPEQESVGSWAYIGNHPTCYLFLQKQGDVKCNFFYSNNGGAT
ncbi:MAG: S8 family serine peptidase, partial [Bacteroidaceae bacterium]|nr:S8 family serine peptidase [Bacteroidaceae bacterium]